MESRNFALYIFLVVVFFCVCYSDWRGQTEETAFVAAVKILPIISLIITVSQTQDVDQAHARQLKHFRYGLVFSLLGDVILNWRSVGFLPGMLMFAIALVFYIQTFRLKPTGYEAASFCYTSGLVSFMFLLPGIKERMLQTAVFVYSGLLMTNWWRTIVRWQNSPTLVNMLAVLGGVSLVVSDFIIGLDKFRFPSRVPYASVMVMSTYYLAQLLMTLSVVNYGWTFRHDDDLREKKKG